MPENTPNNSAELLALALRYHAETPGAWLETNTDATEITDVVRDAKAPKPFTRGCSWWRTHQLVNELAARNLGEQNFRAEQFQLSGEAEKDIKRLSRKELALAITMGENNIDGLKPEFRHELEARLKLMRALYFCEPTERS